MGYKYVDLLNLNLMFDFQCMDQAGDFMTGLWFVW